MPYSLKKVFQKYSLPINREQKNIYSFLEKHFKDYLSDLDALIESLHFGKGLSYNNRQLTKTKNLITAFSQDILLSIDLYFQGYSSESYLAFAKRMDRIQEYLVYKEIAKNDEYRFCRIRTGEGKTWKDLFHIPFDKRELVKGYRYSIAGFPSLYLAANGNFNSYVKPLDYDAALSLAWFETGMPDKFYWSKFKLKVTEPLKILDLTVSPFSTAFNRRKIDSASSIKALITYPLSASCSLISESKDKPFISEYITPQMLLSWVRKNSSCRGIAYLSSSHLEHARRYNAFNVVLPPILFASKGYCKQLRSEFSISKPITVDISHIFKKLNAKYKTIKLFRNWLNEFHKNSLSTESLQEMLSVCDSFIGIYNQIYSKKIKDIQWAYQQLNTLNLCAYRMATKKSYEIMTDEIKQSYPGDEKALKTREKIWARWKTTQELFQDFMTFDMKYFQ